MAEQDRVVIRDGLLILPADYFIADLCIACVAHLSAAHSMLPERQDVHVFLTEAETLWTDVSVIFLPNAPDVYY